MQLAKKIINIIELMNILVKIATIISEYLTSAI